MYPTTFVQHKAKLASRLATGECDGSYSDGALIIAATLSCLAADLWPGDKKDRNRFVQLWVRYAPPALSPSKISIPLLAADLYDRGKAIELSALRSEKPIAISLYPGYVDARVIYGDESDLDESEVVRLCPTLTLKEIREFSYPNLFYRHIRSGLVHEYMATEHGSTHPGGSRYAEISYCNTSRKPYRRIHFDIDWLCTIATGIGDRANDDIRNLAQPDPAQWWLGGGPC
jgi:hypothetical protein